MDSDRFPGIISAALPRNISGNRLLAAVSGGADSVALLRGLHEIRQEHGLDLVVAHLNHGLRGADADADANWVNDLCKRLDIPCVIEQANIGDSDETIEEAARNLRYEFLKRTARSQQCGLVAVAHTADDQTETVLHHILRGTGLSGLQGMPTRRMLAEFDDGFCCELIRPLLQVRRADVETYLCKLGQDYRVDASNIEECFTRNRIRHMLLPLLRERFNPQVETALLRLAQQATEVQNTLENLAEKLLNNAVREESPDVCRLVCLPLHESSPALIRAAFVRLWQRVGWPRQKMGFHEWDRLAHLVRNNDVVRNDGAGANAITLPGSIDARRRGNLLVLRRRTSAE